MSRKTVGRPLVLAVEFGEVEGANRMAVIFRVSTLNHCVMAVNPYESMVMRDGESQYLAVDFLLTADKTEELDDSSYSERHAMSVLAVGDVKRRGATLDLACEKWEVHLVCRHEEGLIAGNEVADEGRELF